MFSTPYTINSANDGSFMLQFTSSVAANSKFVVSDITQWVITDSSFTALNDPNLSTEATAFNGVAVPEPEAYAAVAAAGLIGFGLWRRALRRG